jgi:hypothetical protein
VPAGEANTKNLLRWNYYWTGIKISWRQHWRNWRVWGVVVLSIFFPQKNIFWVSLWKVEDVTRPAIILYDIHLAQNSCTPIFFQLSNFPPSKWNFETDFLKSALRRQTDKNRMTQSTNYNTCNKHSDKKERGTGWKEVEFENNERNCMCVICTNNFFSLSLSSFSPLSAVVPFFLNIFYSDNPSLKDSSTYTHIHTYTVHIHTCVYRGKNITGTGCDTWKRMYSSPESALIQIYSASKFFF